MGKASKWFRRLLGLKRPDSLSPNPTTKDKRRWSFVKSHREKGPTATASAIITTTAAAAGISLEEWAAIKIQAAFRGSLARKALGALKGLVKLQALVRGHIERKRTAEWLQRVQTLLRVKAQFLPGPAQILHSPYWNANSFTTHLHGPTTPDKFESSIRSESMKYDYSILKRNSSKSRAQMNGQEKYGNRLDSDSGIDEQLPWNQRRSWTRACSMDEERSLRILETDSVKPHFTSKRRNLFYSPSQSSYRPLKMSEVEDDGSASKRSPLTPTRSDGSTSHLSGFSEPDLCPNYMAYTESSKAKLRSLSAPKHRPVLYERSTSSKLHGFGDSKLPTQRIPALHASFTNKACPASARLDNLRLPLPYRY